MDQKKALIAMSGGVDSSVAAHLIRRQGYACCGAYMQLCARLLPSPGPDASLDAAAVAQRLDIPFYALDAQEEFTREVAEPFVASYEQGLTPNPCIRCNRTIKFGYLLEKARQLGYDFIVTGHYARIRRDPDTGRYLLYKAADPGKDQSYFLAVLDQQQLSRTLLPLGELTKEQVRAIALEQGFVNAKKKDSQDICFIPDGDYRAFMQRYRQKVYPAGDFLDMTGKIVGRHTGAVGYTLGQRKGLGLAMGAPVYVCAKDMRSNTVTVGPEAALYRKSLIAGDWNWLPFPELDRPIRVTAKARYHHTPQAATVYPMANGQARVEFDAPQRAITPGQAVVLYREDMVVGAGTILAAE